MPKVKNMSNTTYYSIHKDEHVFVQKTGEEKGDKFSSFNGTLKNVIIQPSNNPKYPNNKILFIFTDEDGDHAIQTSEGSLFANSIINVLIGYDNPVGQWFQIGVYTSKGGYCVGWMKDQPGGSEVDTIKGKYSPDQMKAMAQRSFNGDMEALLSKLFEDELAPKLEAAEPLTRDVAETVTADEDNVNMDLADLEDDDLPF